MLPRGSAGAACPGSAQEGPARCAATATSLAERRAGGSCVPTWASSWSCRYWDALRDGRRLQQAGAPLLAEPVAVAANGEDVAVMEQAVEDGGCHHGVAEHCSPLADRAIAGDQHAAPLVEPADQMKQQQAAGLSESRTRRGRRSRAGSDNRRAV